MQRIEVLDTLAPRGRVTFPTEGECFGPPGLPVVLRDDFTDICDAALERTYEPPGGPAHDEHGDRTALLTVADSSGNAVSAAVTFAIDLRPPQVVLYHPPAGIDPWPLPKQFAFADGFETSDEDGAQGGVLHEAILWDGCVVFDGDTLGDRDGLLADETLLLDRGTLCEAYRKCGRTAWRDPVLRVEAKDCGGNVGSDERVVYGRWQVDASSCPE